MARIVSDILKMGKRDFVFRQEMATNPQNRCKKATIFEGLCLVVI